MGKTKILVFKRNRVCNKCLQTWTMGEKARKEGAACSCASATLPALLQSWPALVLSVSVKSHFNSPADTIYHIHGLEFLAITVSEET